MHFTVSVVRLTDFYKVARVYIVETSEVDPSSWLNQYLEKDIVLCFQVLGAFSTLLANIYIQIVIAIVLDRAVKVETGIIGFAKVFQLKEVVNQDKSYTLKGMYQEYSQICY